MYKKATIILAASLVVAAGCVKIKQRRPGGVGPSSCRLVMIYGGGPSRPVSGTRREDAYRMTVYFEVSDSAYAFGRVEPDGGFEAYGVGGRNVFEVRGGAIVDFAVRDTTSEMNVYPADRFATCEFAGPEMRPSMAVFPRRQTPYYSIATFTFQTRTDTVMVEITTSSPNGFGRASRAHLP